MTEYGRELAGWLATLEGGSPFRINTLSTTTLRDRANTLRRDLASLEAMGRTDGPGVEAAQDLLALLERAGA